MKIPKLIAAGLVSAVLALQSWTLSAVVDLKVQVAELKTQVAALNATNNNNKIAKQ